MAATSGLLFGFDTGVISGAQDFLFKTFHVEGEGLAVASLKGAIVSAVPFGALFGAMLSGLCAEGLGRKRSILLTSLIFMGGTLTAAMAPSVGWVLAGRLAMGLAIGISAMVAPMYLSEVSPPRYRGAMVFMFQLAITVGLLLAFLINYFLAESENWRTMFAVAMVPSLLLFAGMLGVPESPRWLVARGREEEAAATLRRLVGEEDAAGEVAEIRQSLARGAGSLRDLLEPRLRAVVAVSFALFVIQQLSGINAVMYYGPQVFGAAGFGESARYLAQAAMGGVNVVMSVVGVWVVDRLGRRPLLIGGMAGIVACLLGVGATLALGSGTWGALAGVLLFIACFAVSLGGVPYILMSELFPLNVRGVGMAVASCANWGFNLLVSFTFDDLIELMGVGGAFMLYAVCTVIGLIFVIRTVPETRGVPLERIEANLYAGKGTRHLGD